MPRIGVIDWLFVTEQAHERALCPWCNQWHTYELKGRAPEPGCKGVYARSRSTAIMVRALNRGVPREPSRKEIITALRNAENY